MNTSFDINIGRSEALRRLVLGMGLIGAGLGSPAIPSWVALVACYPVFTAIMQWDPANVLFQKAADKLGAQTQKALFVRSAEM